MLPIFIFFYFAFLSFFYYIQLLAFHEIVVEPLRRARIERVDLALLFADIDLLKSVSERILRNVESKMRMARNDYAKVDLAALLERTADDLKLYTNYCSNVPVALAAARDFCVSVPNFARYYYEKRKKKSNVLLFLLSF